MGREESSVRMMIRNNVMNDKHSWGSDSVVLVTVCKVVMHKIDDDDRSIWLLQHLERIIAPQPLDLEDFHYNHVFYWADAKLFGFIEDRERQAELQLGRVETQPNIGDIFGYQIYQRAATIDMDIGETRREDSMRVQHKI